MTEQGADSGVPKIIPDTFLGSVSFETVCDAGFNFYELSFSWTKDGRHYLIYHAKHANPQPQLNLVVAETRRKGEDGFVNELYFGTFVGKDLWQSKTKEEKEEFERKINEILTPKHRIKSELLDQTIRETLREAGIIE